jgi:hypothetical protein
MVLVKDIEKKFDSKTIAKIRQDIDEIQRIAFEYRHKDCIYLDTIDHLARVAGMFADVIEQKFELGYVQIGDPQDYILEKLPVAYENIKKLEQQFQGNPSSV